MISRILVPLDASAYTDNAMTIACMIAKSCDAELAGLTVLDVPGIEKAVGSVPLGGTYFADKMVAANKQKALEHVSYLTTRFEEKCQAEAVKHVVSRYQGSPSHFIIRESIFYDLVVIGQRTFYHFEQEAGAGESLEKILDNTITPILAVPGKIALHGDRMNALIAFDGSLNSARALQRFGQLVNAIKFDVKILMAGSDEEQAEDKLTCAASYLTAHGFSDVSHEWTSQNVNDAVRERFLPWADIIVLGIHSHRGLVDFMIGSLSRYLLEDGSKLLLLGQ